MRAIFLDIETDSPPSKEFSDMGQLSVTRIEGAGIAVEDAEPEYILDPEEVMRRVDATKATTVVGHNILRFDAPILERIWGVHLPCRVDDTLIMSQLIFPLRTEHSVESWAKDLGMKKLSMDDLKARGIQDVKIQREIWQHLARVAQTQRLPDAVLRLEYSIASIITEQHARGVSFDAAKGWALIPVMDSRMQEIAAEVAALEPRIPVPTERLKPPPKKQFKKDGTPSAHIISYLEARGCTPNSVQLPLTSPIPEWNPLDVSKSEEVKRYLLGKGWKPTIWNYTKDAEGKRVRTSPKLYDANKNLCPNLEKLQLPVVKDIAEYLSLRNRRSTLLSKDGSGGWLMNARVVKEGRICADANTVGALTGRFTHRIVANVPRVTSPMGKEMRELFYAPPPRVLVGWDASALEACMEAHYTYQYDAGLYAAELLEGDVHTKNMQAAGLDSRDAAKTFKYSLTYGAQPRRLAATFGWTLDEAAERYEIFWAENAALRKLKEYLIGFVKRNGYVPGLDGRRIPCHSPHVAVNCAFQSAGAIVMKYSMCFADRNIKRLGLDAFGLIRYHDEEQWESAPDCAEEVGRQGCLSVQQAGRQLRLKVPLAAEYKIGHNWAGTH